MQDPQSLADPAHVISYLGGWSLCESGWGTDICGGLMVLSGDLVFAIRNISGGARLYIGDNTGLSLRSTSSLNDGIEHRGMTVDLLDGTIVIASRSGDSVMVVGTPSPYNTWYDLTSDHGTGNGVNAIEIL
jgi:hypothetical protein